jgi:hypothetical protein
MQFRYRSRPFWSKKDDSVEALEKEALETGKSSLTISDSQQRRVSRTRRAAVLPNRRVPPSRTRTRHYGLPFAQREPLGWLLVHYDKRDDDLLPFSNLKSRGEHSFDLLLRRVSAPGILIALPDQSVRLSVKEHREVLSPPRVSRAEISVRRNAAGQPLQVDFRFLFVPCARPQFNNSIQENIWRIRVGALPRAANGSFGDPILLFERIRHGNFLPEPGDTGWHSYSWPLTNETASMVEKVGLYLSQQGRIINGTSMWFEDVVGHVGIPDELVFLGD